MSKDLVVQDLTIKPYGICVANKITNGNNTNVVWHVEDMNIFQNIQNNSL